MALSAAELARVYEAAAVRFGPRPLALPALESYQQDPAAFAHDFVDWPAGTGLAPYQAEILERLPAEKRVAVRGPHGLGKTFLVAVAVWHFALSRDGWDWKVVTTASAWRQLTHYLWPEIRKVGRMLRWDRIGRPPPTDHELLTLALKLTTGEAFAVASSQPALIEGAHASHLLYVFDEAKAVSGATFDAAEGAFSTAGEGGTEAWAIAMSTPGEPHGRFYDLHRRAPGTEDWWARHVTLAEAIAAGRVSVEWAAQRRRQWGEGSSLYANRVLGEFASADESGVIPLAWVEEAQQRWLARCPLDADGRPLVDRWTPPDALVAIGVDVADEGADQTVIARRYGQTIGPLERRNTDPLVTADRVYAIVRGAEAKARVVVDAIGVGSGVVHQLRRLVSPTSRVVAFVASEKTSRKDRSGEIGFANKRAAAWWQMRELLDPQYDSTVALPPDDELMGDLTAPHWREVSGGRILIEAKDDIRKRLGRSTDAGDAVVQAFWSDVDHAPASVFSAVGTPLGPPRGLP